MSLTLITGPAVEPVTLAEMKLQCGLGPMEDSDQLREQTLAEQIRSAVQTARQHVENQLVRALMTQTWRLTLDRFPNGGGDYSGHNWLDIPLPLPKYQGLTAFTYLDYAGVSQDMTAPGAWGYQLVSGGDTRQACLRPPIGLGWPVTLWNRSECVAITFTCGYGDTPATVPGPIRNAVKLAAQHLFEQRSGPFPVAVDALLAPYVNQLI